MLAAYERSFAGESKHWTKNKNENTGETSWYKKVKEKMLANLK